MKDLIFLFGTALIFVGGYCFGRAHAAWIRVRNLSKSIGDTLNKIDHGA